MLELTVFKYLHPQERQSQGFYDSAVKAMQDCDVWGFEPPVLYIDINKKIKIDINIEEWEKKAINDMFEGKVSGIAKSFVHPLNFFYEEAMKQKKFLYFLERKGFPNELNFLPKEEKLNDTLKEVLSGKKTLEEFKSDIKSLINLSEKHINFRDKQMAEELETFEDKMTAFFESFQITLPENKKYVQFIGAYHNFEKIAYEKFKDNKNFSLNVFIPDVGKEYRGGL